MGFTDWPAWVSRELGKSSREWTVRHWAAFIAIVAIGTTFAFVLT